MCDGGGGGGGGVSRGLFRKEKVIYPMEHVYLCQAGHVLR